MDLFFLINCSFLRRYRYAARLRGIAVFVKMFIYISFTVCLPAGVWLDDEGLYICKAENQFGTIETRARVSVTGLGRFV